MTKAIWSKPAIDDLSSIKTYLTDSYGADVAQKTLNALILSARWLAAHPHAGPPLADLGYRKWKPRGTRYVFIYRPADAGIDILRVRHERDDWWPVPE